MWKAQKAQIKALDNGATHLQSRQVYKQTYNENMSGQAAGIAGEIGAGFVPGLAQAIDAKDTYNAFFNGGDGWDKAFALAAWIPGLDFLKSIRKVSKYSRVSNNININAYDEFGDFFDVSVKRSNENISMGTITTSELGSIMELDIEVPKNMRGQGILTDIIQSGVNKLNPLVIRGVWKKNNRGSVSTNYSIYMKNLKTMSPIKAALNTPTGKAAQKAGFTKVIKNESPDGVISFDFTR